MLVLVVIECLVGVDVNAGGDNEFTTGFLVQDVGFVR